MLQEASLTLVAGTDVLGATGPGERGTELEAGAFGACFEHVSCCMSSGRTRSQVSCVPFFSAARSQGVVSMDSFLADSFRACCVVMAPSHL